MADSSTTPATLPSGANTFTDPGAKVTPASSGGNSDFLSSLQDTLFKSAGAVSSNTSNIDAAIQGAIGNLNDAQKTSDQGLAAGHAADITSATLSGKNQMTAELESRRGMATNTGIINNIQDQTNKNIADLDEKYQQAISSGDAATASKVADLQLQALQFKQQATQQAFSNQLQIASTMNQAKQTQDAEQKQSFDEQSAVASIGLQFGIPITPGMSLSDVVSKAAPLASQEQQAKLALTIAQTRQAQAEAAKALAGARIDVTDLNAPSFASTIQNLVAQGRTQEASAFLTNIMSKDGNGAYTKVNDALTEQVKKQYDPNLLGQTFDQALNAGKNAADLYATYAQNPFATSDQQKQAASELIDAQNRFNNKSGGNQPFVGGLLGKFLGTRNPNLAKQSP